VTSVSIRFRLAVVAAMSVVMATALMTSSSAAETDGTAVYVGTVTVGADWAPDIEVLVYRQTPGGWSLDQTVMTGFSGSYSFTGDVEATYRLKFHDPSGRLRDEFWNNKIDLASADDIHVGAPRPDGSLTKMAPGGQIAGHVTNESGNPIGRAAVMLYTRGTNGTWDRLNSFESDRRGYFMIGGVAPGTYRLGFESGADTGYVPEFWGDAPDVETGTDITVAQDATVGHLDPVLTPGGRIRGTVTDEAGAPIDDLPVQLYRKTPTGWTQISDVHASAGEYRFSNLPSGAYRVGFGYRNGKYVRTFWGNATSVETSKDIDVTVRETTSDVNISMTQAKDIGYWMEPTIVGTRRVGSPLTVDPGIVDPADATLTYQWVGNCDQCAIAGATSATYTPTEEFEGRTIGVEITASRPGYKDRVTVPQKFTVLPASDSFTAAPSLTVAGSGFAGRPLTVTTTGSWAPAPESATFQWFVGNQAVPGASQATFTPPLSAVSRPVRVEMTAQKRGRLPAVARSANILLRGARFAVLAPPTVRGVARVGKTLRLDVGQWSPRPQRLQYRWYANNRIIPAATRSSYKIPKKYRGKRIRASVAADADGYSTHLVSSRATKKVKPR
jgi:hypothetical protein